MTDYPPGGPDPAGQPPPGGTPPPGGPTPPPGGGYPSPGGAYPPSGGAYPPPPPPASGYASVQPAKVRPGRIWYLLALAVFVAGLAWLIVGITSLASTVNGLQRVPLPAGGTVSLGHSGSFIVYYEGPGAQTGQIPPYHINVAPASSGAAVSGLTRYTADVTYNVGSHHGRAVLTLHVTEPGRFRVTATGPNISGAGLAIGGNIAHGIVGVLLPGLPLLIIGVLAAVILLVVRIARKRSLQRPAYAGYTYPPGPPGPAGPAGPAGGPGGPPPGSPEPPGWTGPPR